MKAICYTNTKTTLPNWIGNLHESEQLGYAYENNGYFIHIYGTKNGLQTISPGLTAVEKKKGNLTLNQWVIKTFGAKNIKKMENDVGFAKKLIWRPGLYFDTELKQALDYDEFDKKNSQQSLIILLQKLNEILLYVEPCNISKKIYGHKLRELLILSCTEFENQITSILVAHNINPIGRNYNTNDYVKVNQLAFLDNYKINFNNYSIFSNIIPFKGWNSSNPTQSLKWYDSYNKTKHNKNMYFKEATLENVINSIAANIVLYCTKFGPYSLHNDMSVLSSLINQMLTISFCKNNMKSFYIPLIELPNNTRNDLFCYDSYANCHNKNWISII